MYDQDKRNNENQYQKDNQNSEFQPEFYGRDNLGFENMQAQNLGPEALLPKYQGRVVRRRSTSRFHNLDFVTKYFENQKKQQQPPAQNPDPELLKNLTSQHREDLRRQELEQNVQESSDNDDARSRDSKKTINSIYIKNKNKGNPFKNPLKKPQKKSLRIVVDFPINGPDGMGWRSYRFDFKKDIGCLLDLKKAIEKDFGYRVKHQQIYRNFILLEENDVLLRDLIPNNDIWTDKLLTLLFIPTLDPQHNPESIPRPKFTLPPPTDLIPENGAFAESTQQFLDSIITRSLLYPPLRDWNKEYYLNRNRIKDLTQKIDHIIKHTSDKRQIQKNIEPQLSELLKASISFKKSLEEFEKTAKKCVELITLWRLEPHDLNYIYGIGGKKYVMGGLVIRECDEIYFMGQKITIYEDIERILLHKIEVLNFLRDNQVSLFYY